MPPATHDRTQTRRGIRPDREPLTCSTIRLVPAALGEPKPGRSPARPGDHHRWTCRHRGRLRQRAERPVRRPRHWTCPPRRPPAVRSHRLPSGRGPPAAVPRWICPDLRRLFTRQLSRPRGPLPVQGWGRPLPASRWICPDLRRRRRRRRAGRSVRRPWTWMGRPSAHVRQDRQQLVPRRWILGRWRRGRPRRRLKAVRRPLISGPCRSRCRRQRRGAARRRRTCRRPVGDRRGVDAPRRARPCPGPPTHHLPAGRHHCGPNPGRGMGFRRC